MSWLQNYHSEWISNLMRPESRATSSLFLIDKDDKLKIPEFELLLKKNSIVVKEKYETPNGVHFVVEPFDMRLSSNFKNFWNAEVHKDGLRLLEIIEPMQT